jgi:hypothetical protein
MSLPPELLIKITTHLDHDAATMNALVCTNRGVHNLLNNRDYYRDVTQHWSKSWSLTLAAQNAVKGLRNGSI